MLWGKSAFETMTVETARGRVGAADIVFVDVRERHELPATGIIPGAVVVPLSELAERGDPQSASFEPAFASGKELVMYCATGRRSADAAKALARNGVKRLYNLAGGIVAWRAAGAPTAAPQA